MEKDKVFSGKIKQSGIFKFKDLYEFIYDFLMGENYDVFEDKYVEKISGDSKDVEINWKATREISDYFRFEIKADWIILGMKKVKVQKEGKEVSMDSGTLEIKFTATLHKDYENRWEGTAFMKFLRGVYDKYIIKSRVEDYELKIFQEVNELIAQTKSYLAMEGQHSIP